MIVEEILFGVEIYFFVVKVCDFVFEFGEDQLRVCVILDVDGDWFYVFFRNVDLQIVIIENQGCVVYMGGLDICVRIRSIEFLGKSFGNVLMKSFVGSVVNEVEIVDIFWLRQVFENFVGRESVVGIDIMYCCILVFDCCDDDIQVIFIDSIFIDVVVL